MTIKVLIDKADDKKEQNQPKQFIRKFLKDGNLSLFTSYHHVY